MRQLLDFAPEETVPRRQDVFELQGIPPDAKVSEVIEELFRKALEQLAHVVTPAGLYEEIPVADFDAIYTGQGKNEKITPVQDIHPRAARLALFAITLGEGPTRAINACLAEGDGALAAMLDSAASAAADRLANKAQQHYAAALKASGRGPEGTGVLRYSPGYCGWHITAQKRLFARLRPGEIGISLTDSCLMQPLKSVSGVIIAGPPEIHRFSPKFPFCDLCRNRTCIERMRSLL